MNPKRARVEPESDPFVQVTSCGVTMMYGNEGFVASSSEDVPVIVAAKGAAVRFNVLTPEESAALRDGLLSAIEHMTSNLPVPFDRHRPETYHVLYILAPKHGGLFQNWPELTHNQAVWDVRQNPEIAKPFAEFHKCNLDELLVSFDGVNVSPGALIPGENRGVFRGKYGIHMDQRLSDSAKRSMQSLVTAESTPVGGATFRFLSGGHAYHEEFAKTFDLKKSTADWFVLEPEHIDWYKAKGCVDTCFTAPGGSQIFWDSRTPHSGEMFIKSSDLSTPDPKIRLVSYICYEPWNGPKLPEGHPDTGKAAAKLQENLKKRKRFLDPEDSLFGRTTSHLPNRMKMFPDRPRSYGAPPPDGATDPKDYWSFIPAFRTKPMLDSLGKRFAGIH